MKKDKEAFPFLSDMPLNSSTMPLKEQYDQLVYEFFSTNPDELNKNLMTAITQKKITVAIGFLKKGANSLVLCGEKCAFTEALSLGEIAYPFIKAVIKSLMQDHKLKEHTNEIEILKNILNTTLIFNKPDIIQLILELHEVQKFFTGKILFTGEELKACLKNIIKLGDTTEATLETFENIVGHIPTIQDIDDLLNIPSLFPDDTSKPFKEILEDQKTLLNSSPQQNRKELF